MTSPFHESPYISSKTYSLEIHIDMNVYKTTFFTFWSLIFSFLYQTYHVFIFQINLFQTVVVGIGYFI